MSCTPVFIEKAKKPSVNVQSTLSLSLSSITLFPSRVDNKTAFHKVKRLLPMKFFFSLSFPSLVAHVVELLGRGSISGRELRKGGNGNCFLSDLPAVSIRSVGRELVATHA